MKRKAYIVVDLGYGDQGKGVLVDHIARMHNSKLSVRFSGGPQAAHHVALPDGAVQCYRQFSSASFVPGFKSIVSKWMLINPLNFILEAEALEENGVSDPLHNVYISENSLVVTPMHFVLNQMHEASRGKKRHGSVGMGVGQTIAMSRNNPKAIRAGDLLKNAVLRQKLILLWTQCKKETKEILKKDPDNLFLQKQYGYIQRNVISDLVKEFVGFALSSGVRIVSDDYLNNLMQSEKNLIFEGSQGILLDPTFGFPPHVTKTNTTSRNAIDIIGDSITKENIKQIGVVRAYSTRHGAGPFVTEEECLDEKIKDVNNDTHPWQGKFRIGWLDLVATRYAISANGGIDELAVTCLDQLDGFEEILVCDSYEYTGSNIESLDKFFDWEYFDGKRVRILRFKPHNKENDMRELTKLLFDCIPLDYIKFSGWIGRISKDLPPEARSYLNFLESTAGLNVPITVVSIGPSWVDKIDYKSS